MQESSSLQGLTLTYTRDLEHWPNFKHRISLLGAKAIHMPLLTINMLAISNNDKELLSQADYVIFTSVNAVNCFFKQGLNIRSDQMIVSIGGKTTEKLIKYNHKSIITAPPPYNSESLLEVFQPMNKKIVIIAASGGRKLLFQQLSRKNTVEFIYTYHRGCNKIPFELVQLSLQTSLIIIASCTTLDCLMENYPHKELKLLQYNKCIAGISAKVADYAQSLGFQRTIYAHQASESALIDAISYWWSTNKESEYE